MTEHIEPVVDGLRQCVAESISAADPIDSTWEDCLNLADAALATIQPIFEAKDDEIQRLTDENARLAQSLEALRIRIDNLRAEIWQLQQAEKNALAIAETRDGGD
ncbi:hypothetical protein [Kutzneria albida]|uniref:Uncharacterized protein n=1 Tax=Kutzneria albida DSM 43870 TaxID=1449976 RepID=W5WCJ9_9PSEU|nr:hypothetical protein [Kutzneria albida]AHH98261.1 hypothetical protein KALB_4899 [Kutzneria albida DSM 43870]